MKSHNNDTSHLGQTKRRLGRERKHQVPRGSGEPPIFFTSRDLNFGFFRGCPASMNRSLWASIEDQ
jgi:hypothetical protein